MKGKARGVSPAQVEKIFDLMERGTSVIRQLILLFSAVIPPDTEISRVIEGLRKDEDSYQSNRKANAGRVTYEN